MELMIEELKERYGNQRVIIFDCPATLTCVDPTVFSHMVDGVLFVVQSERTTDEELRKAMSLYNDTPILGAILNKSRDMDEIYSD
jgi:Mrp family chromosome partitioning ATPase